MKDFLLLVAIAAMFALPKIANKDALKAYLPERHVAENSRELDEVLAGTYRDVQDSKVFAAADYQQDTDNHMRYVDVLISKAHAQHK